MSSPGPEATSIGGAAGRRLVCSKQECPIAAGGLCLEGWEHPEDECETAGPPGEVARADETGEPDPPVTETVRLRSGGALDVTEVRRMTGSVATLIVSIVGDRYSGKSTLLASIFERFQSGPFAGCQFAGSRTLIAFDRLCHPGRARSGNFTPETEPTAPGEELGFLHLAVKRIDTGKRVELLFADRSGEHFEKLRSASSGGWDFPDLREAAVVLLLVDGRRLLDGATRGAVRHNTSVISRAIAEDGAIDTGTTVILTLSKAELAAGDLLAEQGITAAFADIATGVAAVFRSSRPFGIAKVAARSPSGACELGDGVGDLLRRILDASDARAAVGLDVVVEEAVTPYDRFGPACHGTGPL